MYFTVFTSSYDVLRRFNAAAFFTKLHVDGIVTRARPQPIAASTMTESNPFKLGQSYNPRDVERWLKRIKQSKPHPDSVTEVRHVPGAKVELKPGWTAAKPEDFDGLMYEGMTMKQQKAFLVLHADALWTHHKLAPLGYGAIREALVDAGVPTEPWSLPGFEGMRNNPKYKKLNKSQAKGGDTVRKQHVPGLLAGKPVGPGGRAASTNPNATYSQQQAVGAAGIRRRLPRRGPRQRPPRVVGGAPLLGLQALQRAVHRGRGPRRRRRVPPAVPEDEDEQPDLRGGVLVTNWYRSSTRTRSTPRSTRSSSRGS